MKLRDAIVAADEIRRGNKYSQKTKVRWLSELDHMFYIDTIDNPTGTAEAFTGYNVETDLDTKLLAPDAFSEMYIMWLVSKIDYSNNDTARYNNDIAQFESVKTKFVDWYNRSNEHRNTDVMRWDNA